MWSLAYLQKQPNWQNWSKLEQLQGFFQESIQVLRNLQLQCSQRARCSSDEAEIQGYTRTPLKVPTSDLDWDTSYLDQDRRTGWRIDIWGAESHYRKKKKTRHLLVCNWLCSAAFWMKGASAKDSSPPFRLIHSNRPGISWEMTAWNLQLILLNVFAHSLMQTHKC